jgi:hypothetical protein
MAPMRFVSIVALTVFGATAALPAQTSPAATSGSTLIKAARVLDVAAGVYRLNHAVLVSNGRIFADIIAVQGDPLADIAALDAVTFVMKNGTVVTQPPR